MLSNLLKIEKNEVNAKVYQETFSSVSHKKAKNTFKGGNSTETRNREVLNHGDGKIESKNSNVCLEDIGPGSDSDNVIRKNRSSLESMKCTRKQSQEATNNSSKSRNSGLQDSNEKSSNSSKPSTPEVFAPSKASSTTQTLDVRSSTNPEPHNNIAITTPGKEMTAIKIATLVSGGVVSSDFVGDITMKIDKIDKNKRGCTISSNS